MLSDKKLKLKEVSGVIDREIGIRLRESRLKSGYSQEDIAKFLGITFQQVQKYERGLNRISCSTLKRLVPYLKFELNWMFYGDDVINDNSIYTITSQDNVSSKSILRLIRNYKLLPLKLQTIINNLISSIVITENSQIE